jgi:site-specific recombinase XerD
MECIRLRVHDLDFERNLVYVRAAKGGKDRVTIFPKAIHSEMKEQIDRVKRLHGADLSQGFGGSIW